MQKEKTTLEEFLQEWNNGSDRVLVHTSGSTGTPKPLWVEKRRMESSARTTCDFLGLQEGDTALLCLPLDYIAGKMMVVRALVRKLRLVSVEPSGHPLKPPSYPPLGGSISSPIPSCSSVGGGEGEIAFAAMVPMQVWNSLQVPEERERLRSIRHLIIGGGAIDETLAAKLKDFPNSVWSTYGMTETLSHIALRRLNGPEASDWYTPFDGVTVALNDEHCLVIDAPQVCAERLVTNDIAELLPDGRFRILGRRDNVVCSGGLKIQMEEVERLLRPYLPVPFMVTKKNDPALGEAVVLLYEDSPTSGARGETCISATNGLSEEELSSVCRRVLPDHWAPRHYVAVSHLPLTPTGKPARAEAMRVAAVSPRDRSREPRESARR